MSKMIGMQPVKAQVDDLVAEAVNAQQRREAGLPIPDKTMHMVFSGPPGTGKTTVARDIAELYNALGLVPTDKVRETNRADLVGGYVGQTAEKTRKVFNSARGGVLFIDEAYDLARDDKGDYGGEAIAELMKQMEDHRDDTVVIFAGYGPQMQHFLDANPGLRSRVPTTINFPAYSPKDLTRIMHSMVRGGGNELTPKARAQVNTAMATIEGGNAREVRNLYESITRMQARRLAPQGELSREQLAQITDADVLRGVQHYAAQRAVTPVRQKGKRGAMVRREPAPA